MSERFDHGGTYRHHHDADTEEPVWWLNCEQFGGEKRHHLHKHGTADPTPIPEQPTGATTMTVDTDREKGLYGKYRVERIGGTPGKHDDCWYYVLDWMHDKYARPALEAYAKACEAEYPDLARDLFTLLDPPRYPDGCRTDEEHYRHKQAAP